MANVDLTHVPQAEDKIDAKQVIKVIKYLTRFMKEDNFLYAPSSISVRRRSNTNREVLWTELGFDVDPMTGMHVLLCSTVQSHNNLTFVG